MTGFEPAFGRKPHQLCVSESMTGVEPAIDGFADHRPAVGHHALSISDPSHVLRHGSRTPFGWFFAFALNKQNLIANVGLDKSEVNLGELLACKAVA